MGRNTRRPALKIRYRKPGKIFGTKLTLSRNGGRKLKGRVLSIRKLGYEETWRVGDYLPFNVKELLGELKGEKGQ